MKTFTTESFQRGAELGRESCRLGAQTYNLTRLLLARHGDCVFVPIRPMQYLAVIDAEEVIFVDSQNRRWIEFAWRDFRPASRTALDEPVPFETVYYRAAGRESAQRIYGEFQRALALLSEREKPAQVGRVIVLAGKSGVAGDRDDV